MLSCNAAAQYAQYAPILKTDPQCHNSSDMPLQSSGTKYCKRSPNLAAQVRGRARLRRVTYDTVKLRELAQKPDRHVSLHADCALLLCLQLVVQRAHQQPVQPYTPCSGFIS